MEIHPPEKPIHTVRDFLLQLMTITVGILIALSLESVVEWNHHRNLVSEAKENLRQEILANRKEIHKVVTEVPELRTNEEAGLALIRELLQHKAKGDRKLNFSYDLALLSNTSWNTAQAIGAVAYMPYEDVKRYSSIYDYQQKFNGVQDRLIQAMITVGPSEDPKNSSPQSLEQWRGRIQTCLAYARTVEEWARALEEEYDKALK